MADSLTGGKLKKIYKGAFNYFRQGQLYSEEHFEVFKDSKELGFVFNSTIHTRVSTGELLKIEVEYTTNKDWVPSKVNIHKYLGKDVCEENFKLDQKANILSYSLKSRNSKEKIAINVPPRFHIQTPTSVTSLLFILSKKFDATAKNIYSVINSKNLWTYQEPLETKTVALEKIGLGAEEIDLNGARVSCVKYRLMEDVKEDTSKKGKKEFVRPPSLLICLSRHIAIPYRIELDEKNKIEIKFLNNLQDEEADV